MALRQLFFELICVAIGKQDHLSRVPTACEWSELYKMTQKQTLLGIGFAGVQKLSSIVDPISHKPYTINLPEVLFLTWMGQAAKIQQRNEIVTKQCVDLQKKLLGEGFHTCVLKGQGVAHLYGEDLRNLRQSGDIDLWVDGDMKDTISRFKQLGIELSNINIKHADAPIYSDTEVEIHFRPSWFYSPVKEKKLRKWFEEQKEIQMNNRIGILCAPTTDFNLVYLLLHAYRHMLDEGIGLRQVLDYYFILRAVPAGFEFSVVTGVIKSLGLHRFASALTWVLREIFGLSENKMPWKPNEKEGRLLLEEIMKGGNFGHHNTDNHYYKNVWMNGLETFNRNIKHIPNYSSEVLWSPIWKLWHWVYRKLYFAS